MEEIYYIRRVGELERDRERLKARVEELERKLKYPDPESMPPEEAMKFCPLKDPLHFHHDGCPSEWAAEERAGHLLKECRERCARLEEAIKEAIEMLKAWEIHTTTDSYISKLMESIPIRDRLNNAISEGKESK